MPFDIREREEKEAPKKIIYFFEEKEEEFGEVKVAQSGLKREVTPR